VPTSAGDSTAELELEDLGIPDTLLDALPVEPEHVSDFAPADEADESTRLMPDLSADDGYTRRMPQLPETPAVESGGESAEALLEEATRLLANLWPETSPPLDASQSATLAMPELESFGASSSVDEIVLGDLLDESNHPTAAVPVLPPSVSQPTDHGASLSGLRLDELNLGDEPLEFDLDDLARALQDDTLAQPLDRSKFNTDMLATGLHVRPTLSPQPVTEDDVSRSRTNDLDLPELDPVTLSEVGTKLDLARAYLDMGDPDGARAILDEVLSEGSPSQKSEAQRLLETLPG
jgi:pilus assembly protein FimV